MPEEIRVRAPGGEETRAPVPVRREGGYAVFPAQALESLGWALGREGDETTARWEGREPLVRLRSGSPLLLWAGEGVQLAHPTRRVEGSLYVPVQFLTDILPWRLPEVFSYDEGASTLTLASFGEEEGEGPEGTPAAGESESRVSVVVIDPGHGGRDPGAVGARGTREKDVALGIARALHRILSDEQDMEVYLTREDDRLIPLWRRGEEATRWKGERPGVFVSIHANALPNSRATRGFETYFLSEARTEHERRVAALENSAVEMEEAGTGPQGQDPDLSYILTELRNLDHQHWSALLAELMQEELGRVHPGPNRGVKQGPFAVITNALMPSVLLEVGFITNPQEERIMSQRSFQEDAARAAAQAIREFFRRYPPEGAGE